MFKSQVDCWNDCAPDILFTVFKYLNISDLQACLKVNRAWKETVNYFCDHYDLWTDLLESTPYNALLKKRATSNNAKDIYQNYELWDDIASATYDVSYYNEKNVKHIHVHKDLLILVADSVKKLNIETDLKDKEVLDIKNYKQGKFINRKPLTHWEVCDILQILSGKEVEVPFENLHHVKYCYIDESVIYYINVDYKICKYNFKNGKKEVTFLAKYYGNMDSVRGIFVDKSQVHLYLKNGTVYYVNEDLLQLKVCFIWIVPPAFYCLSLNWIDRNTIVCGCNHTNEVSRMSFQYNENRAMCFVFPYATAATRHGEYFIMGFLNGTIQVYKYENEKLSKKPLIWFDLKSPEGLLIQDIEVHQGESGHSIFVLVGNTIARIALKFKDHTLGL